MRELTSEEVRKMCAGGLRPVPLSSYSWWGHSPKPESWGHCMAILGDGEVTFYRNVWDGSGDTSFDDMFPSLKEEEMDE